MKTLAVLCSVIGALAFTFASYSQTQPPQPPAMPPEQVHEERDRATLEAQLRTDEQTLQDWANLSRYRQDDAKLGPPAPGEDRVVFMGDSITDGWGRTAGKFFPGKPYVNRGISGQTTPQMLIRFRPDVIALKPKAVVILAGINDIAGNTGPETLEDIEGNLASMVQLAQVNGIRVVLSSVMPVSDYIQQETAQHPPAKIVALNDWIKDYCARTGVVYVDYYSAMLDQNQMLKKELTFDGLHPNNAGYEIMEPLASRAIERALRKE